MRSLDFNVTATDITPSTANIGNAGEHNVTEMRFSVSKDIIDATDYFRLSIGNFRSDKLIAEDSVVSYSLPQSVLEVGTILLQLDGYKLENDEVSKIFKSALVTAEVGASVVSSVDLPTQVKEPFENAVGQLESLIRDGETIEAETRNNYIAAAQAESATKGYRDSVEIWAGETSANTVLAEAAAATAEEKANAANMAATAAQNHAITTNADSLQAKLMAEKAVDHADKARVSCEEALEHSAVATAAADRAESHSSLAALSAQSAAESADRLVTIIDKELTVYSTLYKNDAPEWKTDNSLNYPHPSGGKQMTVKCPFIKDNLYLCRVWIDSVYSNDVKFCVMQKGGYRPEKSVTDDVYMQFNETLNCFEVELTANETVDESVEVDLRFTYPGNYFEADANAVFGKLIIFQKGNLRAIVDAQNERISGIGENIESALDGIIAIQEELIGGGEA